jgi:hypothetical protein
MAIFRLKERYRILRLPKAAPSRAERSLGKTWQPLLALAGPALRRFLAGTRLAHIWFTWSRS